MLNVLRSLIAEALTRNCSSQRTRHVTPQLERGHRCRLDEHNATTSVVEIIIAMGGDYLPAEMTSLRSRAKHTLRATLNCPIKTRATQTKGVSLRLMSINELSIMSCTNSTSSSSSSRMDDHDTAAGAAGLAAGQRQCVFPIVNHNMSAMDCESLRCHSYSQLLNVSRWPAVTRRLSMSMIMNYLNDSSARPQPVL